MLARLKLWPFVVAVVLAAPFAWAATDAYFAGRAIRMTRTAEATCDNANYSCLWFDQGHDGGVGPEARLWNGTRSVYLAGTTESNPTKGKILVGNGVNWVSLPLASGRQVLVGDRVDGGLKWVSPTDGGLVLP